MKSKRNSLVIAVIIFFCGALFGAVTSNTPSAAQMQAEAAPKDAAPPLPPGPVGRYQISTYGTNSSHGVYLLDTSTGDLWQASQGQRMRVVRK
jgi:hypothetical protein